jgi:hypothetical protein
MTALAIGPVAAVWLASQGTYSYFFPRYLLFTVGAWAVLAGIGLSRLDGRIAVVTVLVIAILSAGDQQVIREPGAHNWPSYPVGLGGYYVHYARRRPSSPARHGPATASSIRPGNTRTAG